LWAARHVNVNTAPRHVLEAALAFGSVADAPKIAQVIIEQRREKPFSDIDEVKKAAFQYSDSVDKCKEFLTTSSTLFKIEVTATSGVATATAVAAVAKEGDAVKQIAVFSD
jgi:type II secretory pathway component PulK